MFVVPLYRLNFFPGNSIIQVNLDPFLTFCPEGTGLSMENTLSSKNTLHLDQPHRNRPLYNANVQIQEEDELCEGKHLIFRDKLELNFTPIIVLVLCVMIGLGILFCLGFFKINPNEKSSYKHGKEFKNRLQHCGVCSALLLLLLNHTLDCTV